MFNDEQVNEIQKMYERGNSIRFIAGIYGCSTRPINKIILGKYKEKTYKRKGRDYIPPHKV